MTEKTDYTAIAMELYRAKMPTSHIIDKYNGRSIDKGTVFYIELINAMLLNEDYRTYSNQNNVTDNIPIIAKVKGVLLYVNAPANNGEVIAVIGQEGEDYNKVIEKGDTKKSQVIKRGNFINSSEKWESINFGIVPQTMKNKFENDNINIPVKKNDIIGYTCIKEYTGWAKMFRARYLSIYEYCKSKIDELKPDDEVYTITPDLTIVNKYVLLHELGIIQFLKDKHGFDEIKKIEKIALLSMILGLDKKGEHSIKGLLSSPRPTDKNYALKEKNIKTVWGELTKLGIMKPKPVKGL